MGFAIIGLVLLSVCHSSFGGWANSWDKQLDYSCPEGQYISRIKSKHDNKKEDRVWEFECRAGYVGKGSECSWSSDYVNNWDKELDYTCPNNGIITGLQSIHSNKKEDRRWKVRCCKLAQGHKGTSCTTTNYINEMDKYMDYRVSHGQAIVGLFSYHSNGREDRRWKVKLCHFTVCITKKMRVLDEILPTYTGRRILGIQTEQGCSKISHTSTMGEETSFTQTSELTTENSSEFTFETTLSVEYGVSAEVFGIGFSTTYGLSQSFGGSTGFSTSETTSSSTTNTVNGGTSLTYTGPAAIMIMAWKDEYEFNTNNVKVEYDIECENGERYKKQGRMNLLAKTYGKTHTTKRVATFTDQAKCNWSTDQCVANIQGDQALYPERVVDNFAACFKNGIAHVAK